MRVEDLAAELWVDISTERQLDAIVWSIGADWGLVLADQTGFVEGSLSSEVTISESHSDASILLFLSWRSRGGHESWIADDLRDLSETVLEGPLAFTGIGEGNVDVLAAETGDWLGVVVEDLAAEGLLLDVGAESDLDSIVWTRRTDWLLGLTVALLEGGLSSKVAVREGDSDGVVRCALSWSSEGACGSKEGQSDGRVLHFVLFLVVD